MGWFPAKIAFIFRQLRGSGKTIRGTFLHPIAFLYRNRSSVLLTMNSLLVVSADNWEYRHIYNSWWVDQQQRRRVSGCYFCSVVICT